MAESLEYTKTDQDGVFISECGRYILLTAKFRYEVVKNHLTLDSAYTYLRYLAIGEFTHDITDEETENLSTLLRYLKLTSVILLSSKKCGITWHKRAFILQRLVASVESPNNEPEGIKVIPYINNSEIGDPLPENASFQELLAVSEYYLLKRLFTINEFYLLANSHGAFCLDLFKGTNFAKRYREGVLDAKRQLHIKFDVPFRENRCKFCQRDFTNRNFRSILDLGIFLNNRSVQTDR